MKNFEILVTDFIFRGTKCSICGTYRLQIKKGVWLCPSMYGSPEHSKIFGLGREEEFKRFLEEEKGCTLDEYLRATTSSASTSQGLCFGGRKNDDCETEEWDGTVWKAVSRNLSNAASFSFRKLYGQDTLRAQSKVPNVSQVPKGESCIEYYNGSGWKNVK